MSCAILLALIIVTSQASSDDRSFQSKRAGAATPASQDPAATKRNDRPQEPSASPAVHEENQKAPDATRYWYDFRQPEFSISHVLIEHDALGRGQITFEHKGEDTPIIEPFELSTGALARIFGLWTALDFLNSTENYQASKNFAHLGTYQLRMDNGQRKRTSEFNWSSNKTAWALVTEYRHVAEQADFVFEMKVARENQPLNAPKLMELLESLFNRGELSDPRQLIPFLTELRTDERIPLIARNHAARLLKKIDK